jgi:hypothetical protein
LALQRRLEHGENVAVVTAPPAEGDAIEIETAIHASDFRSGTALPRCPGPFGGTTVLVLPEEMPADEVDAWLALEKDDPLARQSRFHRLRVATDSGENALATVLAQLLENNRKNVLIVPAVFCADGARMRALKESVREHEDALSIHWRPGLGGLGQRHP